MESEDFREEDIRAILEQLDQQMLPFPLYTVLNEEGFFPQRLGKGGFAYVYPARHRTTEKDRYALRVSYCGDAPNRSEAFWNSVSAQENTSQLQKDVVEVCAAAELRVWIEGEHTVVKTEVLDRYNAAREMSAAEGNVLRLQFLLMKKLQPVLDEINGRWLLRPEKLAAFEEEEILRLAYDIGKALQWMHEQNWIHGDIKLQNILYADKGKHYRLGDFGSVRKTKWGFARTASGSGSTPGYAAPEVHDRLEYDYTADIYSLGIVLYRLLNDLNFPNSGDEPCKEQYQEGFEPKPPVKGSKGFQKIVLKMIRYRPEDRYQTIEEVLRELDGQKCGKLLQYKKEHKKAPMLLGIILGVFGAALAELAFTPAFISDFSIWEYLFWGVCMWEGIWMIQRKNITGIMGMLFCLGICLLVFGGFSWWKLAVVIVLPFTMYFVVGCIAGGVLIMRFTYLVMKAGVMVPLPEYGWIAALLISLSLSLVAYYDCLDERYFGMGLCKWQDDLLIRKNLYWVLITLFYTGPALLRFDVICLYSYNLPSRPLYVYLRHFLENTIGWTGIRVILYGHLQEISFIGVVFCLTWMAREWILANESRIKERFGLKNST